MIWEGDRVPTRLMTNVEPRHAPASTTRPGRRIGGDLIRIHHRPPHFSGDTCIRNHLVSGMANLEFGERGHPQRSTTNGRTRSCFTASRTKFDLSESKPRLPLRTEI